MSIDGIVTAAAESSAQGWIDARPEQAAHWPSRLWGSGPDKGDYEYLDRALLAAGAAPSNHEQRARFELAFGVYMASHRPRSR